jgi:hypothetical protein
MNILFLCRSKDIGWGQWGLVRACERRGIHLTYLDDDVQRDIVELVASCAERPSLILHPELDSVLPRGLEKIEIPTACFQIDTYSYTKRRIRWSMLFDHPIVFHPGYEGQFRKAGHYGAITIYHSASLDLFDKPEVERIFDVGWVGRASFNIHSNRRRILTELAQRFRLNEWERFHSFEEMAEVYRRSKIVVNIARDDFPQDANMRAFEAMAAGSLLINRIPTELTEIGFQEGVHFVGYTDPKVIASLAGRYLSDETARRRITEAAREKVLREHTYDCRVSSLVEMIEKNAGQFIAPARGWSQDRVRLAYLDYYSAHMCFDHASEELRHLAGHNLPMAATGGIIVARRWAGRLRSQIFSRKQRAS